MAGSVVDFPGVNRSAPKPPPVRPTLEVHSTNAVPAWRAELSARVQQVKARRNMEAELEAAMQQQQRAEAMAAGSILAEIETFPAEPPSDNSIEPRNEKPENPLVEAALNRVRRGTEISRRLIPDNSIGPRPLTAMPRQRVQSTAPIVTTATAPVTLPDVAPPEVAVTEPLVEPAATTTLPRPELVTEKVVSIGSIRDPETSALPIPTFDSAFDASDRPAILERLRAGGIDLGVVATSCLPIWLITSTASALDGGALLNMATATASVAAMYFFGTIAVSGQTFGMMWTGLRTVDVATRQTPTITRSLLRALGMLASFVPALAGFLWVAFDRNQRGLHEYLSGTETIRDRKA